MKNKSYFHNPSWLPAFKDGIDEEGCESVIADDGQEEQDFGIFVPEPCSITYGKDC